jgi:hypothetical protein
MSILGVISIIAAIIGAVVGVISAVITVVSFMHRFERDIREDVRRDIEGLREEFRRDINELRSSVQRDIGDLRERLIRVEDRLNILVKAFGKQGDVVAGLIEQLGKRGILEGVDAWKTAFGSISLIIGNPLTEDEKRRLLGYINKGKDEFTPEEVDDFERLAKKFWEEHMDKDEAWYLLLYAAAVRGITYGRYNKELMPLKLT